jgi:hypothetical protein
MILFSHSNIYGGATKGGTGMNKKILFILLSMVFITFLCFPQEDQPVEGYVKSETQIPAGGNDDPDYQILSSELHLAAS